jgi:uncharacterized protein (TIGR02996 family)
MTATSLPLDLLALLRAAKEEPDDLVPRRLLADWLEEHGQPERAEHIRLQLERVTAVPRRPLPGPREAELLARFADDWLGPLRPYLMSPYELTRGLLHVTGDNRKMSSKAGRATLTPESFAWVECLRMSGVGPVTASAFAALPALAGVLRLNLYGNDRLEAAGAQALAKSPHLANLIALNLHGCFVSDTGLEALANSTHLAALTDLRLQHNGIGDVGVTALTQSKHLMRLRRLSLLDNLVGNRGVIALANSPILATVAHLDLSHNHFSADGVFALAHSPYLGNLYWLGLQAIHVSENAAAALNERFPDRVRW